ncbi:class I adenylate-forming enzyme family protein [Bradyrhizobium sp. LA7.1]|uniref:class I adenylate-forming enzyme family protein n=1 Tax=Bradyrhizobium sp. LA7.1 TaxID=3156324 RepID=UPI0033973CE5
MRIEAGGYINRAVEKFGHRTAISGPQGSLSFTDLNGNGNQIGSGLVRSGLARGDRVAVLSYNRVEVAELWIGLEKHNLVRVVMHSHFDMAVHVATLNQVEASALIFDTRFTAMVDAHRGNLTTVKLLVAIGPNRPPWAESYEAVRDSGNPHNPCLDVDEEQPSFLQLTTGTTGNPKPWIATFRSWRSVIQANAEHFDTFGEGIPAITHHDVNLHFHPLQWATGFQTLFPYFLRGARTVLLDDEVFDPVAIVRTIAEEKVTGLFTPGPMLTPILDEVEKHGDIKGLIRRLMVFIATPEQLNRTTKLLGPVWAHGFGSTEQGAPSTRLTHTEAAEKPGRIGSVGRVISPYHEIRIADERGGKVAHGEVGEIIVRSPMSSSSYWKMPEQTANAFFPGDWFRPRDVGYIDADGFLFYLDRAKDCITTAQGIVYPHTVESALQTHSAVANCGVVGITNGNGQEIVGAILLKSETIGSDGLAAEILALAKSHLKSHEVPARLVFIKDLPTVLGGAKVQRDVLQRQLLEAGS